MDSIMYIYNKAEKHGYEQHLHLNELPPQVAVDRSMDRYFQTGRYVDTDYIYFEVGNKPIENYKTLKEKNIFQSYQWLNNDVEFGEKPILIEKITKDELDKTEVKEKEANYIIEEKEEVKKLSLDNIIKNSKDWVKNNNINQDKENIKKVKSNER